MQSNTLQAVAKSIQQVHAHSGHNRLSLHQTDMQRRAVLDANSTVHNSALTQQLQGLINPTPPSLIGRADEGNNISLDLFNATARAKTLTSYVSMHLDDQWRKNIFVQLDMIHEVDEWDEDLSPVNEASMKTFLKAILKLKVCLYPGLGLSNKGNLIAAWTKGSKRLTLEYQPEDKVKWLASNKLNEFETERAAGTTSVARLYECLAPYDFSQWFVLSKV
jgi:hypothetical protein